MGAAYLVYKNQEGLYKYLQTISIYLVMPITPSIVFGILSKRVNMKGAVVSVIVGMAMAGLFVTDQLMEMMSKGIGEAIFPFLHRRFDKKLHVPRIVRNDSRHGHACSAFRI